MPLENKELVDATQITLSKNTPLDIANNEICHLTPNIALSKDADNLLQNSLGDIIFMIIKGAKNAKRY